MLTGIWYQPRHLSPNAFRLLRVGGVSAFAFAAILLTIGCGTSSSGDSSSSGSSDEVAAAVAMDWVTVGDPGNACDPQEQGCFGAVAESYQIGKYEVTNAQYAEFLNAVASSDANALYVANMGDPLSYRHGGITRSGSSGSYTYSTISGRENMPVNNVDFYDTLRFANWLHNGQPTGAQDNSTTEDGAYTITAQGIADNSITRNVGATVFLPSEDEWYKAAYYDPVAMTYYDYPAGSDTQTTCTVPGAATNAGNCDDVVADLTDVGSYTGSPSPNGTFDQGGNIFEWNENNYFDLQVTVKRGFRGGIFYNHPEWNAAAARFEYWADRHDYWLGFRVASLPEPAP